VGSRSPHPPQGGRGDISAAAARQSPPTWSEWIWSERWYSLREKIGDFAFFSLLRTWATQNR
jgi:hypothetical protein